MTDDPGTIPRAVLWRSALLAAGVAALLGGCENVTLSSAAERQPVLGGVRGADASPADLGQAHDALLVARLTNKLKHDPITDDVKIDVSVSDGRARLSGFVDTAAAKLRAGMLASETPGIRQVDNRLILRYRTGAGPDPIGNARVYL